MPRPPATAPSIAGIGASVYSTLERRLADRPGEIYPFHVGDTWLDPADGCRMQDLRVDEFPRLHGYARTRGVPRLVDAVVERVRERSHTPVERDEVLVTAGATGGLSVVAGAILDPGDEVLVLGPYWPLIAGIVRARGAGAVIVPFIGEVDSPETAVEQVRRHATAKTTALYLSTPNNPTGRVLPRAWVEALVEWARRENLWILSDEVYEDYVFDDVHTYARSLAPERTFSVHSFSKAYGMAGNRCGYVTGPSAAMDAVHRVHTHAVYSVTTASQVAAWRALGGPGDRWVAVARERYRELGAEAARRLGVEAPQGSTFLFLDVAHKLDDRGLQGFLGDCAERGLLLAPGPSFGPYPTHVRVCYTSATPDVTARGVEALAGLLEEG